MLLSCALLFALFVPSSAPAQNPRPKARETDGNKLVQVALKSDRDGLRAGDTFQLCVVLDVKPRWHVYWENAGDAGTPTNVEVSGPKGFEFGTPRFPCPARHEEEGDIVSYIHEGQLLVLVDAKAPKDLVAGAALEFRVDAEWLVCTEYCLPGTGRATLTLASAAADSTPKPLETELFTKARAAEPRAWKDVLGDAKPVLETLGDGRSRVVIDVQGATELELSPWTSAHPKLLSRERSKTQTGARIVLELEQINGSADVDYRGVLWIRDATGAKSCLQEAWRPAKR